MEWIGVSGAYYPSSKAHTKGQGNWVQFKKPYERQRILLQSRRIREQFPAID